MLAHWNDSPLVDMSPPFGHIILISRQPVFAMLLLLLYVVYLAEKQEISISKSLVWPDQGLNPQ